MLIDLKNSSNIILSESGEIALHGLFIYSCSMSLEYYSQRLLNPFRGIVNIVKYQSAEAVSTDGNVWDIYVSNDLLREGLELNTKVQTSDIRYGKWSHEHGLVRGPLFPSDDFKYLEEQGAVALTHVQELHDKVPFPMLDNYELWLLDQQNMPLALLDSAVHQEDIETDCKIDWRAGNLCRKSFTSSIFTNSIADDYSTDNAAAYLTYYINSMTANPPVAQWFLRENNGNARGLAGINLAAELESRILGDETFPAYLLNHTAHDETHQQLVSDFLDWQAPWLLLLPTLKPASRSHYEQSSLKQALIVEQQYKLYPEIIDQSAINTARVEAKFRNSQVNPEEEEEEKVLSTFYLELNPSSAE